VTLGKNISNKLTKIVEKFAIFITKNTSLNFRDLACRLLSSFNPSKTQIIQTFAEGLKLCCSPKFGLCESGGILLALSHQWSGRAGLSDEEVVVSGTEAFEILANRIIFNKGLREASQQKIQHLPGFKETILIPKVLTLSHSNLRVFI